MPSELSFLVGALLGLLGGAAAVWWKLNQRIERSRDFIEQLQSDLAGSDARLEMTQGQLATSSDESKELRKELQTLQTKWASAVTQVRERTDSLREQKETFEKSKAQLVTTFQALAGQALNANNEGFLKLAETRFGTLKQDSEAQLDARKTAIETLVKPMSEALEKFQNANTELEKERHTKLGSIGNQLQEVATTHAQLQAETNRLVTALRSPTVRGRWGELALKKAAEMTGMLDHCDFQQQVTVDGEDGKLRPDMVIKLPAARDVVVDSKVPMDAFLDALAANTDELRNECLQRHAAQVESHVNRLTTKAYWEQFPASLDFVVLFIPIDSCLNAALDLTPGLVERSLAKKVVLASPSTFFVLLRALEFAWKQHTFVENALKVRRYGQELSDRLAKLVEHLNKVGGSLGRAVDSFNSAVGSLERRVMPMAREFRKLGVEGRKELENLKLIEDLPRGFTPALRDTEAADLVDDDVDTPQGNMDSITETSQECEPIEMKSTEPPKDDV